jgi:hypothetical protein
LRRSLGALALAPLLLVGAAPAAVAMPSPVPNSGSSVGIRLIDAPVSRRDDPRAYMYIIDYLNPGDAIVRHIEVTNLSATTRTVALYPAAATVTKAGFTFANQNRQTNELTNWVTLEHTALTLQPKEHAQLSVKINIPKDATRGEHYGVIWAEEAPIDKINANVIQVGRVGIRMYLSIGPGGEPPSDFTIDNLAGSRTPHNDPVVTARIHNTGGRALDLSGQLTLTDGPGGLAVAPIPVHVDTLAIGDSRTIQIPVTAQIPQGTWHAKLTLTGTKVHHEADATITFGQAKTHPAAMLGTTGVTALLTVAAVLLIALLGVYTYRHRKA